MSLKVIRRYEQLNSRWSGGTTRQLYIYPENSTYLDRNFLFRISTATVDTDESMFTQLPGVSRHLMILEGSLKIEHTGRYTKILQKFETDSFEGDWETKGFGMVTDFNLMTTGKVQGTVHGTTLMKAEPIPFQSNNSSEFIGMYLVKGKLRISSPELIGFADEGNLILYIPDGNGKHPEINAVESSEVAVARITLADLSF